MIKNTLTSLFGLFLLSCVNQKKEVIIDNQKLLYDSTQTKDKSFNITIITTMKVNDEIEAKDLNEFYIIANTDTLVLNIKKMDSVNQSYPRVIEYSTMLRQKEKEFGNDNFIKSVENYEIKNRNININAVKSPEYSISPLIKLWKNNNKNIIQ